MGSDWQWEESTGLLMMPQSSAFKEVVLLAEDQDTSKGNCQCEIASDKCHGNILANLERSYVPGQWFWNSWTH